MMSDESYDLFDERYELWLQKYHPEDTVVCKALFEEELKSSAVKIGREKPKLSHK